VLAASISYPIFVLEGRTYSQPATKNLATRGVECHLAARFRLDPLVDLKALPDPLVMTGRVKKERKWEGRGR